jgi:hypothetical protein
MSFTRFRTCAADEHQHDGSNHGGGANRWRTDDDLLLQVEADRHNGYTSATIPINHTRCLGSPMAVNNPTATGPSAPPISAPPA